MYLGEEFKKYATHHHGISSTLVDHYIGTTGVQNMTQYVIEERDRPFRAIDVFTRLMADRIIFIGMPIDDYVSNLIVAQLLFLESTDAKKDILMYINSPGGSVYAGMAMYDTMQYVSPDISTICTGLAASMAAVLLCSGQAKKRIALPHSRIMIHQPLGGASGQASDIEITAKQIMKIKQEIYEIIAKHSGQDYKKVSQDSDRDFWMNAEEAAKYGIIDEVMRHKPEVAEED